MATISLTETRITAGVWQGVLTRSGEAGWQPVIKVTHQEVVLGGHTVEETGPGVWLVKVPIPAERIGDGVQTFVISDAPTGQKLASFALVAGEPLAEDLRAEIDLLRAELDMLKRAFRRHCVETM
jgi:hypothetical protein